LRCRWAWLQRVDPDKPWAEFDLGLPRQSWQLFHAATCYTLGNGERARFWQDCWIRVQRVEEIALNLLALVPPRKVRERTVKDGLSGTWLLD